MKRKSISKKTRFEVFKRDGFKCQYCGRSAPEVVLEVDHIIPVCKGGYNDVLNLVTACYDCNHGKQGNSLDDSAVISKQLAQLQELNERREQVEMMADWRKGLQEIDSKKVDIIIKELLHKYGKPLDFKPSVKSVAAATYLVKAHSMDDIFKAIDQLEVKNSILNVNVFKKIESNLKWLKIPKESQQLYYVRGIIKNRLEGQYYSAKEALDVLSSASRAGIDTPTLQSMAKEVVSWEQFVYDFTLVAEQRTSAPCENES